MNFMHLLRIGISTAMVFLCFPTWAAHITQAEGASLTRLLTTEVSEMSNVNVVSSAELSDALSLESEKQAIGCVDQSCIAEIAAAMGTSHVLQSQLGTVGSSLLLSLQIFDDKAAVLSRKSIRAPNIDALIAQLRPTLKALLKDAQLVRKPKPPAPPAKTAKKKKPKVSLLVLRVVVFPKGKAAEKETEKQPPKQSVDEGSSLLFYSGLGALVIAGASAAATAGLGTAYALQNMPNSKATQAEILWWFGAAIGASVVTGVAVAAGGILLGLDLLTGDAHVE